MTRHARRPRAALVASAAAALLVSGCGSTTARTASGPGPTPSAAASPPAVPTAPVRDAASLLAYLDGHREQSAMVVLRQGDAEPVVSVSADTALPLASTRKVLVLAAVADLIARGRLEAGDAVPLADVERWYAPGTDGGAHPAAVKELGATWTVDTAVEAMITFSDNAAADWLLERVGGPPAVAAAARAAGMTAQQPVWSLLGEFLAWEREPAAWLAAGPKDRLATAQRLGAATRGPVALRPPSVAEQRRLAAVSSAGTAADWAGLLSGVLDRAEAGDPAARYTVQALSWPRQQGDTARRFEVYATKGGSLPGVLTDISAVRPAGGRTVVTVQLYRDLPAQVEKALAKDFIQQELARELATDDALLARATAGLGD